MASKLFRRIAIVVSTIAALVILLTAVAHTPFVRSRLLTWALSTVARDYGLHVDARSLRYNLATRSIALDGVSVAAAAGEPALLRADVVRVVLTRGLFLGTVAVDHLEAIRAAADAGPAQGRDDEPSGIQGGTGIASVAAAPGRRLASTARRHRGRRDDRAAGDAGSD